MHFFYACSYVDYDHTFSRIYTSQSATHRHPWIGCRRRQNHRRTGRLSAQQSYHFQKITRTLKSRFFWRKKILLLHIKEQQQRIFEIILTFLQIFFSPQNMQIGFWNWNWGPKTISHNLPEAQICLQKSLHPTVRGLPLGGPRVQAAQMRLQTVSADYISTPFHHLEFPILVASLHHPV